MPTTPRATFGDVVLEGATSYRWTLRGGVAPSQALWSVDIDCAQRLEPLLGQPQDFVIEGPRGTLVYSQLYALEILPGSKPYTRRIRVADKRWQWPYHWLAAGFNIVRGTGERYLVNDAGNPSNAIGQDRLIYEPSSLKPFGVTVGATRWGAVDVLEYLLTQLPPDGLGEPAVINLDPATVGVEVQDLFVDDAGDTAIKRVLAYLSGVSIYQAPGGAIVVYDTRDPQGEEIAGETRPGRLKTGPESIEVDRRHVRPSKVVSLFTVDAEVRFDFEELATDTEATIKDIDEPRLYNVAHVTDQSIDINGSTLARGSVALLNDLFAAWGAFGVTNEQITLDIMRTRAFDHGWARFETSFSHSRGQRVDEVFSARAHEASRSWRSLYRIAPTFFGRLESVTPTRAAILNTEQQTRAPAAVYSDYVRRPSIRGLEKDAAGTALPSAWAVRGHTGGDLSATTYPAPASVSIDDAQVGTVRVKPLLDPFGIYQQMVFGFPTGTQATLPVIDGLGASNRSRNLAFRHWTSVDLIAEYHLALVMTVTPATPRNRERFYAVETDIGGSGPPIYSRVFPGITTARFAWADGGTGAQIINAIKGREDWRGLEGQLVNPDIIRRVHDANVKRLEDIFRDRTFGGHDIDLDPTREPIGSLSTVSHIMASGVTATQMRWEADAEPVDIWSRMDASTRQAITRVLNGQGTRVGP